VPIRYGEAERWKKVKEKIGRTKPTRAPGASEKKRVKNDGRPPDTTNELLISGPSKMQRKEAKDLQKKLNKPIPPKQIPSYQWEKNSCWLDTSLELLHATVSFGFEEFTQVCRDLPSESILRTIFDMLEVRQYVPHDTPDLMQSMALQRTQLRLKLVEGKIIQTMKSYESLFVSEVRRDLFIALRRD
jgi:hypothetical protein